MLKTVVLNIISLININLINPLVCDIISMYVNILFTVGLYLTLTKHIHNT